MRTSCKLTTDVLVVGSGFSGFWAAMTARKHVQDVLIVDKGPRDWGGIGFLSGGDLFAMTPDMDREKLLDELVYYYDGLCDQEVLGDILDESYARFTDYERMGHEFVRDANGKLMGIPQRGLEHVCCFHSKPYGKGGSNFTRELAREVGKRDIRRLGRIMITDVVKNGDTVCGAVGFFAQSGRPVFIEAKAVILTTNIGGWKCTNMDNSMASGAAELALNAGVALRNCEFLMVWNLPQEILLGRPDRPAPQGRVLPQRPRRGLHAALLTQIRRQGRSALQRARHGLGGPPRAGPHLFRHQRHEPGRRSDHASQGRVDEAE